MHGDCDGELTRGARSVSDMMSGMAITRDHDVYEHFTQDQLEAHFSRFKEYDVDQSGFITPDNLKEIFVALDFPEVTEMQCVNMIAEVAILIGHDNDGKISFRDYCHLMAYEAKKQAATEVAEATEELRASMGDTATDEVEPTPQSRMRGSSFAVLDQIAVSRIQRFEQLQQDAAAQQSTPTGEVLRQTKFAGKLAKFRRMEDAIGSDAAPKLNDESLRVQTLKAKLAAFEEAAKKEDPVAFKLSWKNVRQGTWRQKKQISGGVAPKRALADLP